MATKATDIDVSLFQIGRMEDSTNVSSQKIAWINYDTNKGKLNIQTLVFVTETYGIPREGVYYPTDRSRAFFSLSCPSVTRGQGTLTRWITVPWRSSTTSWWSWTSTSAPMS